MSAQSALNNALDGIKSPINDLNDALDKIQQLKPNNSESIQLIQIFNSLNSKLRDMVNGVNCSVLAIESKQTNNGINGNTTSNNIIDKVLQKTIENNFFTSENYYGGITDYLYLTQNGKIQAQYVWIGGTGLDMRCKTRTLNKIPNNINDLPTWNYDGSSTGQAEGRYSEVWLNPVKYIKDPFRRGNNIIVLCETLDAKTMTPLPTNKRGPALRIFSNPKVSNEKPWFGIEQEYTMFEADGKTPLGWPKNGFPGKQGPYYCSVGARKAFGRKVVETHYRACLYAGISISGINAEVMPGQWEFQIGPCEGIDSGDQLWLARYLLERCAEEYNVVISFDVKPIPGDWNGAGCHTNYSTLSMRQKGGLKQIIKAIKKMEKRHDIHMQAYGKGNERRLTGYHETQKYDKFSYGVADRGASIRIPRQTDIDKKGYFEDRRPGANMDPYDVTALIAETTILYDDDEE